MTAVSYGTRAAKTNSPCPATVHDQTRHHDFDIDKPGKDSYEHRRAGATEVLVTSANRWALLHELRGAPEPDLGELLAKLAPVDVVLCEGSKRSTPNKIEVHRPSLGKPLLYPDDAAVVAVASDTKLP